MFFPTLFIVLQVYRSLIEESWQPVIFSAVQPICALLQLNYLYMMGKLIPKPFVKVAVCTSSNFSVFQTLYIFVTQKGVSYWFLIASLGPAYKAFLTLLYLHACAPVDAAAKMTVSELLKTTHTHPSVLLNVFMACQSVVVIVCMYKQEYFVP